MAGFTVTTQLDIQHNSLCRARITGAGVGDDESTLIDLSAIPKKDMVPGANGPLTGGLQPLGIKIHSIKGIMTGNITLLLEAKCAAAGTAGDQFIKQFKSNDDSEAYIDVNFEEEIGAPFKPYVSEELSADVQWTGQTNSVNSQDSSIYKVGAKSEKFAIGAAFTTGLIGYLDVSAVNMTSYDGVGFWIRSSVALQPADLSFLLDNTSACASPYETLPIDIALAAGEWKWIELRFVKPSQLSALLSMGLQANRDFGAANIYIDGIRFKKFDPAINIPGIVGDIVATSTGAASGDHYEFDIVFSLIWGPDSFKGTLA